MAETLRGVIERSHFFVYIILWLRHFGFTKKKRVLQDLAMVETKFFSSIPNGTLFRDGRSPNFALFSQGTRRTEGSFQG